MADGSTSLADPTRLGSKQFLTFHLAGEEYGMEIERVQEIKGYAPVTPLPNSPAHVRGVLNLRGVIVPVVDLRRRLGLAAVEYTRRNAIIVAVLGARLVGMVVDEVSDVIDLLPAEMQEPPAGAMSACGCVKGLARVGDRLLILLDVARVVALESPNDGGARG